MNEFETKRLHEEKMQNLIVNCSALKMDPDLVDHAYLYYTAEREYSQIWTKEELQNDEPIYYYYRIQILGLKKEGYDQEGNYLFVQNWGAFGTLNHRRRTDYLPLKSCIAKFMIQSTERSRSFVFSKIKENDINKSDLPVPVQELIVKYIFDINFLKKMIDEYTFDVKSTIAEVLNLTKEFQNSESQMPRTGYSVDKESRSKIVRELLNRKITCRSADMIDDSSQSFNLMNFYYKQLHTSIKVVDKSTERFRIIEKYFNNSQSSTHFIAMKLENLFEIERPSDDDRYAKHLCNKQLLWHGTRVSNIPSILYEGFRTTKARANGIFGAGTYFSNSVTKSMKYCCIRKESVLLLCEVALGEILQFTQPQRIFNHQVTELPDGKNSVRGRGKLSPESSDAVTIDHDVLVPYGKLANVGFHEAKLNFDEFVVYNPAQIKMRYLVTVRPS